MKIFAKRALLATGWENDVVVNVGEGTITNIMANAVFRHDAIGVDTLLPALGNLHSHTFQRAMAGMTEVRAAGRDTFWTWRDLMYRFVDRLTPEQVEAIAAFAFMEMQEVGYASVAEFHYIHHQKGGTRYDNPAELSDRIFAAAMTTGIGLTHLPVLYTYGGAGKTELAAGQLRFGNDVGQFQELCDKVKRGLTAMPADCKVGNAPHSLRATSPDDLRTLLAGYKGGPVHIHIAEQTREVEDVQAWLGRRPVEWLLDNLDVNDNWCLIHATHMSNHETEGLARSQAVAGLCPITEANLGDGIFNGAAYLNAGGVFGVGTDSNVQISLVGELRQFEYSQRLRDQSRNVLVVGEGSVGQSLYASAAMGGAQALGRNAGAIAVGNLADLVAIDSETASLWSLNKSQLLDGFIFAAKEDFITHVWSAGRHCVQEGKHIRRDEIVSRYKDELAGLVKSI